MLKTYRNKILELERLAAAKQQNNQVLFIVKAGDKTPQEAMDKERAGGSVLIIKLH